MKVFIAFLLCAFASGLFAADVDDDRRIVDGGQFPADLIGTGQSLGLHTEELGMGGYQFTGRRVRVFAALFGSEAACLNLGPGERPPKPPRNPERVLWLNYTAPHARASLEAVNAWNATVVSTHVGVAVYDEDGPATLHAALHLEHGVTAASLRDFVRRFCREVEAFERHLKSHHP